MILELKGIYKEYQQGKMKVPVLKDVNFSMEEGEYVAIMGPSGSGKTTLMNIIGCLDKQTEGTFFLAVFLQLHQSRCNSASCDYHHKHSCEDFLYFAHEDHLFS